MEQLLFLLFALFIFYKLNAIYWRKSYRKFIQNYKFKSILKQRLLKTYPHLKDDEVNLVFQALREYFELSLNAKNNLLAMPSQVVDIAWHEFILNTREYTHFCNKAFGKYLHHTPTEVMREPRMAQESIKRIWKMACKKELISHLKPNKLPLLFAIDGMLNIEDGFKYTLNCDPNKGEYCASHVGCSGGGCSGSDSGCSSGCGGGCGGG